MSEPTGGFVAVVPAAGSSRRMGRDKLLLPWRDTVVLGSVADALRAAGAATVVVVASAENFEVQTWVRDHGHTLAVNAAPQRGMLSSILVGLEALGGVVDLTSRGAGLLVCPGDHAGLEVSTVVALGAALGEGAVLAFPSYSGRPGHPLAIAPALLDEIRRLDPGVGLRQLVSRHAADAVEIPVTDPAVARDLDTPEDYESAPS